MNYDKRNAKLPFKIRDLQPGINGKLYVTEI